MAIDKNFLTQFVKDLMNKAKNKDTTINPRDAKQWVAKEKPTIIDVRPPMFYENGHLPDAKSIPLPTLSTSLDKLPQDKNKPILIVCNLGNSSVLGMIFLRSIGYNNVKSLNNGTIGWKEKGFPIEK